MKLKVIGCKDCPFRIVDVDYNVCGYDSLDYCKLTRYLTETYDKYVEDTIRVYDSYDAEGDITTPDWCRLNELTIIKDQQYELGN